jgi:hypothetical protein
MARSAAVSVAVLILSGFAWHQQVATHTVVRGDTLWDLSNRYYQTPWEWRRIWEANRDKVQDPNLIYPHQVLTIPGREATVTEVAVEGPEAPSQPAADPDRTVFYRDPSATDSPAARESMAPLAVARDAVFSAPWLIRLDENPASLGRIEGFAGGSPVTETPRGYDRIRLSFEGTPPAVGEPFQAMRVFRTVEGVGKVVRPTGIVTISSVDDRGVVAIVTKEFERMQLGDLVGPLPAYGLSPGQSAVAVAEGPHAMIMAFAGENVLQGPESIAFLDLGSEDGVAVGDEFDYVNPDAGPGEVEGRLQVIGVRPHTAAARIVGMDDVVFKQGLVVRLVREMR